MCGRSCYVTFALFLALLSVIATGASAENHKKPLDAKAVRALLEPIRKKHDVPALAAAVVTSEGLVAAGVVGVRKRGAEALATVEDQFHLGSDTKPMTAWLIAWLIEQGLLDWNTPLEKIFPELAKEMTDDLRRVTPTHLLTHHAGLPANLPGGCFVVSLKGTPGEQRQRVVKLIAPAKLEHRPGEKYHYSNVGYVVLGVIVEKVTGDSWEARIRKNLFGPLGMKSAGFGPMGEKGKIDQPWQHTGTGEPVDPGLGADNPAVMGPAGRVHCSLPDWARFMADHLGGARGKKALLKQASYQKMQTTPFEDTFYTLGGWLGQKKAPGKELVLGHDGSNTMNYCSALMVPEEDFAVLIACNQGGEAGKRACHEGREALVKAWLEKAD